LLIYEGEKRFANLSKPDLMAEIGEYDSFGKEFASAIQGGNALQPTSAATTVRVREGRRLTTDGPFAATKEQLGGHYLVEAAALEAWREGVPKNARGWLYKAGRHDAIDRLRRTARFAGKQAELAAEPLPRVPSPEELYEETAVPDERLRLIFTCCHPALAPE